MEQEFFYKDEKAKLIPLCRSLLRYGREAVANSDFARLKAVVKAG